MTGQPALFTLDQFVTDETKIDPGYYDYPERGDICTSCQTTVKAQWSGIACDCGKVWFCL